MSRFALPLLRDALRAASIDAEAEDPSAAVAAILRDGRRGAEALLIKRAERASDPWSGHVAFPGGKRDAMDASILETAIRETAEEVGLTLSPGALLARLDDVRAHTNGYRVAEFVFALDDPDARLAPNGEVAATLWVPLEEVAGAEGKDTMTWDKDGRSIVLPCVRLGDYVLWGMTYRMVSQIIAAAR